MHRLLPVALLVSALASCRFELARELGPGELRGTVVFRTAEGGEVPAPQAHVDVQGSRLRALADRDGRFVVRGLPPGAYTLAITVDPATGTGGLMVRNVVLDPGAGGRAAGRNLGRLVAGGLGSIGGTVRRHGEPLPGAQVVLTGLRSLETGSDPQPVGTYELSSLAPGTYELCVVAGEEGGAVVWRGEVRVEPLKKTALDVTLDAAPSASGQLQGFARLADGANPKGISVSYDPSRTPLVTDGEGMFQDVAPAGVYDLVAHREGYEPVIVPDVVVGGADTAFVPTIVLAPFEEPDGGTPDGGVEEDGGGGPHDAGHGGDGGFDCRTSGYCPPGFHCDSATGWCLSSPDGGMPDAGAPPGCPFVIPIEIGFNVQLSMASDAYSHVPRLTCASTPGPDVAFGFTLQAPSGVDLWVDGTTEGLAPGLAIALRGAVCDSLAGEQQCALVPAAGTDSPPQIHADLQAGSYHVIVDQTGSGGGPLMLRTAAFTPAANGYCMLAESVAASSLTSVRAGSPDDGLEPPGPCSTSSRPARYWKVSVPSGQQLIATAVPVDRGASLHGRLAVTLLDTCGPRACVSCSGGCKPAGAASMDFGSATAWWTNTGATRDVLVAVSGLHAADVAPASFDLEIEVGPPVTLLASDLPGPRSLALSPAAPWAFWSAGAPGTSGTGSISSVRLVNGNGALERTADEPDALLAGAFSLYWIEHAPPASIVRAPYVTAPQPTGALLQAPVPTVTDLTSPTALALSATEVFFLDGGDLWKAPATGGTAGFVAPGPFAALAWVPADGLVYFGASDGLRRVAATGGVETVASVPGSIVQLRFSAKVYALTTTGLYAVDVLNPPAQATAVAEGTAIARFALAPGQSPVYLALQAGTGTTLWEQPAPGAGAARAVATSPHEVLALEYADVGPADKRLVWVDAGPAGAAVRYGSVRMLTLPSGAMP